MESSVSLFIDLRIEMCFGGMVLNLRRHLRLPMDIYPGMRFSY